MKCPFCTNSDTKVIDSRGQNDNTIIRRRRACEECGKRFTTFERIETLLITVTKRDGARETFERGKLQNGIVKSCSKRPVTQKQIDEMVDEIETAAMNSFECVIESKKIGEMVMQRLKEIDEIAYVRFASVYRQFKDINTFIEELVKLLEEKNDRDGE